jgi:hypothetical protein
LSLITFAHIYKKTLRNMNQAANTHGFSWSDPSEEWKRDLLSELAAIAASHRMKLTVCSQPAFIVPSCGEASCIDAGRLEDVAGRRIRTRVKGNRPECRCFEAKDIGEHDTCPHGCIYCYAVENRNLALGRYREHRPESEFLFPPSRSATESERPTNPTPSLFKELDEA